jgi:hypothetical protein
MELPAPMPMVKETSRKNRGKKAEIAASAATPSHLPHNNAAHQLAHRLQPIAENQRYEKNKHCPPYGLAAKIPLPGRNGFPVYF